MRSSTKRRASASRAAAQIRRQSQELTEKHHNKESSSNRSKRHYQGNDRSQQRGHSGKRSKTLHHSSEYAGIVGCHDGQDMKRPFHDNDMKGNGRRSETKLTPSHKKACSSHDPQNIGGRSTDLSVPILMNPTFSPLEPMSLKFK